MHHEYEAKFLRVDPALVRAVLRERGANLVQPERLMRRKTFDFADRRLDAIGAWIRVRDEGDKVSMSYKQITERTMEGMKEAMVIVSDFEQASLFLSAMGLVQTSFQENRRETWNMDECEVVIDWWPWILPLVEIEGPNEECILRVATALGFDWTQKIHGGIEPAYQDVYAISPEEIKQASSITFDQLPSGWQGKQRVS
jgi:adenylate cyclase class 2